MIDQDAAIAIARKRAKENGWGFAEPVLVEHRRGWRGESKSFEIETNAGKLGTKARFVIDAGTGEIIREGYIPR